MEREEHFKQISLACLWSAHSVWTTLGFPQFMAPVLSQSTLLRLQVALKGNCPKQLLCYMHFPCLSCSGLSSRVLHKEHRLSLTCVLCPSQVRTDQATRCLVSALSQVCGVPYHLPSPSRSVSWVSSRSAISGVPCVSSGELISGCDPPRRCQPSRIPGRLG